MDWGRNNILAVALGSETFLWNSENGRVQKLLQVGAGDYPTSVAWSGDAKKVAVGYMHSKLQIWDAETSKLVNLCVCVCFCLFFFFVNCKDESMVLDSRFWDYSYGLTYRLEA